MIVRMKKVTMLVTESQKRDALLDLRELGVVHIRAVEPPVSPAIDRSLNIIEDCEKAVNIAERCEECASLEKVSLGIEEVAHEVKNIICADSSREALLRELDQIKKDMDFYTPWGSFDPAQVDELKTSGVKIKLYKISRSAFKKLESNTKINLISSDAQNVYIALISDEEEALDLEPVKLPQQSFEDLYKKKETVERQIEEQAGIVRNASRGKDSIIEFQELLTEKNKFLNVLHGMKREEEFAYLQGFCPVSKLTDLTALAKVREIGYLIEEPTIDDDVPTLIENPKWIKIIAPVFKFMDTVPGYKEHDISVWFLMFFSLFFAILIGDAGYGLLFLTITFLARKKFKKAASQPFVLMYVFSKF